MNQALLSSIPSFLDDASIDVHGLCCDEADCAMRIVSPEDFLEGFPLQSDHPHFSLTVTLDGSETGKALMRSIAGGLASISSDGYVRAIGVIGSTDNH